MVEGAPRSTPTAEREIAAFFSLGVTAPTPISVANRIRAAIDLGVLADGAPLPKEAPLARQLKVTVFTLREALAQLRDEGMIVTRVGRGGGSFVHHPPDQSQRGSQQLAQMTSIAIRELADWRAMLAGEAAALASDRASAANLQRMESLARAIRSDDVATARRAIARFRVEVAAAAQSIRLSKAMVAVHEEFAAVLELPINEPGFRAGAADHADAVLDAVRQRDGVAARRASVTESHYALNAVMRIRLRSLAGGTDSRGTASAAALGEIAWALPARVLGAVTELARETTPDARSLLETPDAPAGPLASIMSTVEARLKAIGSPVQGMGILFESGALSAQPLGGPWFVIEDGAIVSHPHVADPRRDDFYDYSLAEWLTIPRESRQVVIVGPYVDAGGTDEYILTVAAPIAVDGRFLGVAAADIPLAYYELSLAMTIGGIEQACCIVNAEGRIVVSNTTDLSPGSLLPADRNGESRPCGDMGWAVFTPTA